MTISPSLSTERLEEILEVATRAGDQPVCDQIMGILFLRASNYEWRQEMVEAAMNDRNWSSMEEAERLWEDAQHGTYPAWMYEHVEYEAA